MTEITSHMILRYFRDESPEEEFAIVRAWLLQHPDELERYLTEEQWERFQPDGRLPEGLSASMYGQIEAHIEAGEREPGKGMRNDPVPLAHGTNAASMTDGTNSAQVTNGNDLAQAADGINAGSVTDGNDFSQAANGIDSVLAVHGINAAQAANLRRRTGWRLPAVAAILLVTVAAWYFIRPTIAPPIAAVHTEEPAGFLENTTGKPLAHRLPDGSGVLLQPGASLRYKNPFVSQSRNITLSGKARFDVARNPAPFTVSAGKTNTTALGTVFEISSIPGNPTTVLLISGKVKVQAGNEKDIILRPGDQLRYDASLHSVQVTRPEPPARKTPPLATIPPPNELIPTTAIIHFDNTPLTTLFRQLESREKLHLLADPALLRDRYFTGSYNSGKESLDDFLQTIAVLNNLQIRLSGDSLLISP